MFWDDGGLFENIFKLQQLPKTILGTFGQY